MSKISSQIIKNSFKKFKFPLTVTIKLINLFSQSFSIHSKTPTNKKEKATKWQDNVEMDGLTTNGVLIMHPKGKFCGGTAKCGLWRETSLGGDVFSLRESRSAQQKGQPVSFFSFLFFSN
jgi:hypothetical protein